MKRNPVKKRLNKLVEDISQERHIKLTEGNYSIIISGLTEVSKEALLGRNLIIRHFPLSIGRISPIDEFSSMRPDFVIPDKEPVRISRKHVLIDRQDEKIVMVDENSRFGSLVNDVKIGKKAGGKSKIPLKLGKNEVKMGGNSSPFIFEVEVRKSSETRVFHDYINWGDHIIPVAVQYIGFCHRAGNILRHPKRDMKKQIQMALKLAADIASDLTVIEMLHCYSAHPETFSDIIVAHSINVAIYAIRLACGLSYAKDDIIKIGAAALLHDIGLYDTPKEIVYKKKTISPKEFEILKRHPVAGYEKLIPSEDKLEMIPTIALEHHERVDGSGYPYGKKVLRDIVELLSLVDFFEAITHHRPQRGPITPHQGIQMLLLNNQLFTPKLLSTFINIFSLFPVFSVVRLNSGEIGQVVKSNVDWVLRPVVRLLFNSIGDPFTKKKEVDLQKEMNLFILKDVSDRIFIQKYFKI
ncbi:HD domain-containing phosphohydrolase [Thermodesulfobacteriota bacterium]